MASPRLSGQELWRRARIKTVVSRRFTSSCSSFDEENGLGLDGEDDVYISCFEDVSDSDIEIEEKNDQRESYGADSSCLRQNSTASERAWSTRSSSVGRVSKRSSGGQSVENQDLSLESQLLTVSHHGDHHAIKEEEFPSPICDDGPIDFVDMPLSRDNPDMGLGRAIPNFNSLERQRLKQREKIPKLVKFKPTIRFGWFDMCIGIVAIIVFFVDIGTDIELAAHYLREEMWMYGGVTFGLILFPSLITCFLGLHWYIIDYKKEKALVAKLRKAKKRAFETPGYVWVIRFTFTLLQIGPVIRIIEYLRYGHKSRCSKLSDNQRRRFYLFMLYEDVDSCLLRLFESFLESAPQLTWQLYIAIVLKPSDNIVGNTIRSAALLSSWASLAISLVSYHKSLRNSHEEKAKMSLKSLPVYFIWRACEVGGRVICIAMFASTFKLWVFGPVLFHWFFMSFWLMAQRTTFYKNKCLERAFNIICGYVMIFCFLNLREGHTRFRFLFFYTITYVENFFMLTFWFRFSPDLGAWFHLWGFVVVLSLFFLHMLFQLLYYAKLHPTGSIEFCLPCDPYIIYSSICHDVNRSKRKSVVVQPEIRDFPPEGESIVDVNGHPRSNGRTHREEANQNQLSGSGDTRQQSKSTFV